MKIARIAITLAIVSLLSITVLSQQIGLTFGGPETERAFFAKKISDRSVILIGQSASFSSTTDIYVIKTDLQGKKLWQKTFGEGKYDLGWGMEEVDGGKNYLIAGFSIDKGHEEIILLKISSSGNLVWIKSLPSLYRERCYGIRKVKDNNFILTGQTQDKFSREVKGLITKIDGDGNILWKLTCGDEKYNRLYFSSETKNGDIFFSGIIRKDSTAENKGWFFGIDKHGKQKISKILDRNRNTTPHGIVGVSHDKILLFGYAQTDTAMNQRAIYLAMFNWRGKLIWEKTNGDRDRINHGIGGTISSSGHIMLTGYSKPLNAETWDGLALRFSKGGELIWRKEFGGSNDDEPYSISEVSKNEFVITGFTNSFGLGKEDLWFVKIDHKGAIMNQPRN